MSQGFLFSPPPRHLSGGPIIFSGIMVRAILEGRKTQTRRIVRGQGCRYAVGNTLWVQERWRIHDHGPAGNPFGGPQRECIYQADEQKPVDLYSEPKTMSPSDSRIELVVTNLRQERLQAIDEIGLEREGFADLDSFIRLWNILHRRSADQWNADPMVWVVTFESRKT